MTTPDPQTLIDSLTLEVQQLRAETGKLRLECEHMRPVFVAALVWRDGQHAAGVRALIAAVDVADPRELGEP